MPFNAGADEKFFKTDKRAYQVLNTDSAQEAYKIFWLDER